MKSFVLLGLACVTTSIAFACSAPDPGFSGPPARGHSGVVGSTSGSGSSSGGSSAPAGGDAGSHAGSSSGSSSGGAAADAGSSGGGEGGVTTAATYGTACATSAECAGNTYNVCQLIQQQMICTKPCGVAADCPAPPTGGTCNANGYCK